MWNYWTIFQDHHQIEQQTLKSSKLLAKLQETGRFDIHAQENRIFLPADSKFAQALDITPHSGGPLGAYQYGVIKRLEEIQATRDGRAALRGDPEALDRVVQRVEQLRDTIAVGLINNDLNTNTPVGLTPEQANTKVQGFYRSSPDYYQAHAQ